MVTLLKNLLARHDRLSGIDPLTVPLKKLESALEHVTEEEIRGRFRHDPWLENFVLNVWEKVQGRTVLQSYPWHMALNLVDVCNAKCPFCPYWMFKSGVFDIADLPKLMKVVRYARTLILTGGEPTVHPRFPHIIKEFGKAVDPRCSFYMITNGDRLARFKQELAQVNVGFSVSLNAATTATHSEIMGLGEDSFERILKSIRWLKSINRYVSLSFIVMRPNIHEIPEFLDLSHDLNVDCIYLRTLTPTQGLTEVLPDYLELAPYLHPQFEQLRERAVRAIEQSRIPIQTAPEQWSAPILLDSSETKGSWEFNQAYQPAMSDEKKLMTKGERLMEQLSRLDPWLQDMGDPYRREHPFSCNLVYYSTQILEQSMKMYACCFMPRVPGFEEMRVAATDDFFELWNSPALVQLRRSLQQGPLYPACKTCTYQLEY